MDISKKKSAIGPVDTQFFEYSINKESGRKHCIKRFAIFPSPAGKSLTKLSWERENR